MAPFASVSLDLDNLWSYLRVHGDPGWERYPSYLSVVVPRVVDFFAARAQRITVFVVGQDAELEPNLAPLRSLAEAGHDIGNHSFGHEPWMARWGPDAVHAELARAEVAIERATGVRPTGFRGPGFALSANILEALRARGYAYDASTWPTFVGPLARAYYLATAPAMGAADRAERAQLFGSMSDGLRPNTPYRWSLSQGDLLEIPVSTCPGLRAPIHLSYVLSLARFSIPLALAWFKGAARAASALGHDLSLLLHPLDFMGPTDAPELAFFPGMELPLARKLSVVEAALDVLARRFVVGSLDEHAAQLRQRERLPKRKIQSL